jgi:anti-repressor protein
MKELQRVFDYQGCQVRTVMISGEPHFVAKDVCEILTLTNPTEAVRGLDDDEKTTLRISEGGPEANVVTEAGLYSLVIRSNKPEAKQFKRWVTHDVLPTIRKTGQYGGYQIPHNYAEALRLAADQADQLIAQKPKVLFADSVTASNTSILIGELAKIIKQNGVDIGQNRLFEWLRDKEYLISRKGTDYNMPTQRSMNMGLFTIKETTVNHSDGHISVNKTSKVTGKGQVYFVNKFLGASNQQAACYSPGPDAA